MKTPEEARALRCCGPEGCGQMRHINVVDGDESLLFARDSNGQPSARFCIADKCMAWLWGYPDIEPPVQVPTGKHGVAIGYAKKPAPHTHGYCGYIGRG